MKVFYIQGLYDGCYYVRSYLPLMHNGWDGTKTSLRGEEINKEEMIKKALASDIIVFHRPDTKEKTEVIRLLKGQGKKIVFDNDDTYRPDSGFPKLEQIGNKELVDSVNIELYNNVKQADLVTTTTEILAEEYRPMNKNVIVLPNCVDPFDWDEPLRNECDKVRIGLLGSVGYDDYKIIEKYLLELTKRKDVQLVMFGLSRPEYCNERVKELYKDSYEFVKNNIEWHTHVRMADYFNKVNSLRFDLLLIPRRETYFNKCKSNLKFLEASMLEIPVIASSFSDGLSPYDKDLDGSNGILCKTEEDWRRETERLIANKELRRQIGRNAKEYVLEHYNIENNYLKWANAYSKL